MEVLINGRRFDNVPAELAPLLRTYAERQGRSVVTDAEGRLLVDGPDPLLPAGDGGWISANALALQEARVVTPTDEQT